MTNSAEMLFFLFSNEVRLKGVRARPVGGAGAYAPEEVHFLRAHRGFWCLDKAYTPVLDNPLIESADTKGAVAK